MLHFSDFLLNFCHREFKCDSLFLDYNDLLFNIYIDKENFFFSKQVSLIINNQYQINTIIIFFVVNLK